MSEWAIGDGDTQERTAYEYREFYLDQELEFKPFTCPFCDVPLTPVNLYTKEEIAKSPHFRADKGDHRSGCDGSPLFMRTMDRRPPKRHVERREFQLPEALVPRRPPVITSAVHSRPPSVGIPDEEEVKQRRKRAAESLGPAVYRTSLIRSVAIAFLGVFKESYEQQKKKNWTEEQRRQWVKGLLEENRLTLYDGYTLTYQSAIRNIRFPPPPKPRIFHGWASVTCCRGTGRDGEYVLTPNAMVEHTEGEDVQQYPVEISIRVNADEPVGSQRYTLERLDKAASKGLEARWFAYGVLHLQDDGVYRMTVDEVDHLYLHRLEKPVGRR